MATYTIDQLPERLQLEALDNLAWSEEGEALALREKNLILDEVKEFCKDAGIDYLGDDIHPWNNYVSIRVSDFAKTHETHGGEGECYYGHLAYEWGLKHRHLSNWLELAKLGYDGYVQKERELYLADVYGWWYEDMTLEEYMWDYEERATELADEFMRELKATIEGWLDGADDYGNDFDFVKDEGVLFNEEGIPLSELEGNAA